MNKTAAIRKFVLTSMLLTASSVSVGAEQVTAVGNGAQALETAYQTLLSKLENAPERSKDANGDLIVRTRWQSLGSAFGMQRPPIMTYETVSKLTKSKNISVLVHCKTDDQDFDQKTACNLAFKKLPGGALNYEANGCGLTVKLIADRGRSSIQKLTGDNVLLQALCVLNFPEEMPGGAIARECLMTYVPDSTAKNAIAPLKLLADESANSRYLKSAYNNLLFSITAAETGTKSTSSTHGAVYPMTVKVNLDKTGDKIVESLMHEKICDEKVTQKLSTNGDISIVSSNSRGLKEQVELYRRGPGNTLDYSLKSSYFPTERTIQIDSDGNIVFSAARVWNKPFQMIPDAPGQLASCQCWMKVKPPVGPRVAAY